LIDKPQDLAEATQPIEQPPFPIAYASEVARNLSKAVKAHQLYLPNNPMRAKADEALRLAFDVLWRYTDKVMFEVGETEFRCAGETIYEEPEKTSESIPWTFYKDGIREFVMRKGFERSDLKILLDLLQRVRSAGAQDDDDLLTLMWEEEFANLEYRYVEPGGDVPYEALEPGERTDEFRVHPSAERLSSSVPSSAMVRMEDFDTTLYFLDDREIEYLRGEIAREFSIDLRPSIVAALLDTFEQQNDAAAREEIAGLLEYLLILMLSASNVRGAAFLLRELVITTGRTPDLADALRHRLTELPSRLSEPAALSQLLETVELLPASMPQVDLPDLFALLKPAALETVFLYLSRTQNPSLRTLLEGAADRLAAQHTAELVRLIASPEPSVAEEAIQRAGSMKTAAAVPVLSRVVSEGLTLQVRLTAVLALGDIGSPGALQALERALDDGDRDIRIGAVRALVSRAYRAALPRVERALRGKALRESNLAEKLAFYEAYGALAGEAAIQFLDQVLNGRSALGRREEGELRACAAAGLSRIKSDRALESLAKAASDRDILVRNAVARAMREGER
jgi:hypothetical protein